MTGPTVDVALGLDGGGTQTRVAAATTEGVIRGRGWAGACNLAAVPPPEALAAALAAADLALAEAGWERADVLALCAGVAGVSYRERRDQFHAGLQAAFPRAHVVVEPDYAIALAGATGGGPGVIVIAGTGSAAYGENAGGQRHKTGAYGYLIDDAGSGYGIGRAALAAILRAADGTGEPTSLSRHVLSALGLSALTDIIPGVYGGSLSRVAIAGLSRTVAEAALTDNDAVARTILMRAGGALAHLTHGVTQRLFADADAPFPVISIGGLWNAGGLLTDVFTRSLRRFAPTAILTPPLHSPVEGAVLRAVTLRADA
jgi:glucosamine kinase